MESGVKSVTGIIITICIYWTRRVDANANLTIEALQRYTHWLTNSSLDFRIPPIPATGDPIDVRLSVYINAIGDINEMEMDFSVNMFLRHYWKDERLAFDNDTTTKDSISVPDEFYKGHIWMPDTFFENGKSEYRHDIIVENSCLRVYRDGTVFHSQRLSVQIWCFLYLYRFPLDEQECELRLMSYRFTSGEMRLRWMNEGSVENLAAIRLARFKLMNVSHGDCTTGYTSGAYSCVNATFKFQRQFRYYLIQIYVPSSFVVLLSWVSFWLDPLAVPGRISLGVLTILTMSTQMASAATSSLPKVSYIKAIDVWLTTCMCFLFAALIEFALVNSLARRAIHKTHKIAAAEEATPKFKVLVQRIMDVRAQNGEITPRPPRGAVTSRGPGHPETPDSRVFCGGCTDRYGIFRAVRLDVVCRIIFPLCFVIFNVIYWLFYTEEGLYGTIDTGNM